jgi:hypothetical protein
MWAPWALLGTLGLLTVGAAILSVATTGPLPTSAARIPVPVAPFTGFGGYTWYGDPTSINASWTVPTIISRGPAASAATWIGAQGRSTATFVQVGTLEVRLASGDRRYEAFWSDGPLDFHAQHIRDVVPGDAMETAMRQTPQGWDLDIDDVTQNWTRTVSTHYRTGVFVTQGEWVQEDPAPTLNAAHDVRYPVTTVVRFDDMRVDGDTPNLTYDDAQALSGFGGVYLVPTVYSHGHFSLPPAEGAARQYLADAARYDTLVTGVDVAVVTSPKPLTVAERGHQVARVVAAIKVFNGDLTRQTWPAAAQADITRLVQADTTTIDEYAALEAARFKVSAAASQNFRLHAVAFQMDVEAARAALGLPPL